MRNLKSVLIPVLSIIALVMAVAISTAGPALAEQGREFMGWIVPKRLTVQGFSYLQDDVTLTGNLTVTGDTSLTGGLSHTGDITVTGNIVNRSLLLRYQDVAAAPSVYAEAQVATTTTTITTSILGIDTPRNVVLQIVTSDLVSATAGTLTISGIDARGTSTTEDLSITAVGDITQTLTGSVPWSSITSFAFPASRAEVVTLTVTGGQLFGLPIIPAAAGDVYHVTVNATPQANPTVDTTNGTFNPVSTPAANVDYNVWMKQ